METQKETAEKTTATQKNLTPTTISETKTEELSISNRIDSQVALVLADKSVGIEKALVIASAMEVIDACLTEEIMRPIMRLQGSKLGFKTDMDLVKNQSTGQREKGPGYPLIVVKNCFIEMALIGLQPVGNQWNIIGGNSYVTKEGGDELLKNIPYLQDRTITHEEVTQSPDKKTATVKSKIKWVIDGLENIEYITWPVKSDPFTTFDALIGKADRKSKIWLFNKIKGTSISDGDADENKIIDVTPNKPSSTTVDDAKTRKRILNHIANAKSIEDLEIPEFLKSMGDDHELLLICEDKKREILNKK